MDLAKLRAIADKCEPGTRVIRTHSIEDITCFLKHATALLDVVEAVNDEKSYQEDCFCDCDSGSCPCTNCGARQLKTAQALVRLEQME